MQTSHTQHMPEGGLLQSRGWAVFQKAAGKTVVALPQEDAPVFGIVHTLPVVGRYLYVPRGAQSLVAAREQLIESARRSGCGWVRIEPASYKETVHIGDSTHMHIAPHDMQPRCVLQMSLAPSEDELLAQMKSKTRYNVRLAQKKGVEVMTYHHGDIGADDALEKFIALVGATADRKSVQFHSAAYYRNMFAHVMHESGTDIVLYVARYEGEIIAANLVTVCGDVVTYLHGATSDAHRNVMAPFALQWQQIVDAKKRGCTRYDFGGFFPEATDLGKVGITRFKEGFAPNTEPLKLPGAYDIVLSWPRYMAYRALQKLKGVLG